MLRSLVGTKADVRLKMMAAEDDFIISPPRKTVRFGGTVTEVLEKYKQGDINDYELLKHQLLDPEIKDAQIINWLHEFRSSVMYLTKDFEQLVVIVLKMPWLRRSKEVVEEYLSFLGNLVSAQTIFLRPCLSMIVSFFIPPRVIIKEGDVDISDSEDEDENLPGNFDTCHRALQIVARYVPSAPRFLMPILAEKFPFVTKSARTLECYVHNLLRITVYFPALRADVLQLVTEKLLKMDVSASRQDIEEAEEAALQALETGDGTTAEEGLFNMDEDEDAEAQEKSMGSLANEMMAHPIAERLDLVLSILFSYIKDVCYINGEMDLSRTKDLYRDLLAVFDKLILPTHASCAVQYSMFYVCSFKLGLAEAFLEHLWKKLQNPNNPAVIRQAACNYIGSFLARATFLPIVTVKACLDLMVNWLHLYIDNQDAGSRAFCDVAYHGPFYSACQAVFYTFVFRHKQLLERNLRKGLAYLQGLNFERIVMCQLNPLKICLPSVVSLFAAITRKYQLVFCYTIIERNNRQLIPTIRSSTGGDSVQTCINPLDSFFPFDPCVLKRSKKVIDPVYQVWEDSTAESMQEFQKPPEKAVADEDDFLKGETPQTDSLVGSAPGSYDSHLLSPASSVGSPPVRFLQQQL
ncbi:RNA polymerase I-specific transcription initiation factor RRN3 isoform X1 [Rhinatrema bivittatum]|uniref:RNA polymerase I-specific transcription initiation factor RRN3 isoform X1 n=1 Tax=Rhinatrema bivittatum TaxID=194408 RepID=UPI00112ED30B|nr:RNA polymerase I-specific transcription initiation factor RRN3 isoform X1 [Rhinatrema bivittatum]XP_029432039.1 RNA polymerase I-specific transcription initiation factor RRN3 isoform X1 [Rhinatrema bivittatum]